jgi:D-serine deaminase-like pyridoxal phosphate-dependent protein
MMDGMSIVANRTTDYFASLNAEFKATGLSRPLVFIDLDLVDANLDVINRHIRRPLHYRVVDKSLPSVELVRYVMEKTGSKRVMTFHLPYLSLLFRELDAEVDFLLGKPMPISAAKEFHAGLSSAELDDAAARVQWLVDTPYRLEEYRALAEELGRPLRINVEVDVGLRRGGAKTPAETEAMLAMIEAHPKELRFAGFMGYDGHVSHAPAIFVSKERAIRRAHRRLVEAYRCIVDDAARKRLHWFEDGVTLNGAGSQTYRLYAPEGPLNDLSMGSCVVKPAAFNAFTLSEHRPAMYIAAPVLKKIDGFDVPFLDSAAKVAAAVNPNWRRTFYVYGGAWSESVVWPEGVRPNPLTTLPVNENLFPNQNMLNASDKVALDVGDFVFYHPKQGDAMSQFETTYIVRGGKIIDQWRPLPRL